jgi:hypothetical protein
LLLQLAQVVIPQASELAGTPVTYVSDNTMVSFERTSAAKWWNACSYATNGLQLGTVSH